MTEPDILSSSRDIADASAGALRARSALGSSSGSFYALDRHPAPLNPETKRSDAADQTAVDVLSILSDVQETAFTWDVESDRIEWAANARPVLGVRAIEAVGTGTQFELLMAPEHIERRRAAMMPSDLSYSDAQSRNEAHYRVQYRFTPGGRRTDFTIWLEEHGQCSLDSLGQIKTARGVVRVINEQYWEEQRLLHMSDHDELTGQLNRIRLTEALGAVLTRSELTRQSSCFLMACVDNLATINDSFGFEVGDEVIAAVARIIKSRLRGGDSMGRYSSNKIGIILNDCGPGAMRIAAERFIKAVREATIRTGACQLSATISIGGVRIPDQASTIPQALGHALQALDRAIARGDRASAEQVFEDAIPEFKRRKPAPQPVEPVPQARLASS